MSADLLIELRSEELPARFVRKLAQALRTGLVKGLDDAGIKHGEAQALGTPRRIATLIQTVEDRQPDQNVERRGPALAAAFKDGQATKAAEGFARSCGVSVEDLQQVETDKGAYLHFSQQQAGKATSELMQGILDASLKLMDELVPKRMRWGAGEASFVRPVHGLIALHGDDIVPLTAFGLSADRSTLGHRFHSEGDISIDSATSYLKSLRAAHVLADMDERREIIRAQVDEVSQSRALIDEGLLEEVTALVEWPQPILGQFEDEFLQLPREVIISTIQEHQRYFPVMNDDGSICNQFVTIANLVSKDVSQVVSGNEKVVRPRLSDALFFWQQDLASSWEAWLQKLENVTYIQGLGSIGDKVNRMQALASQIAPRFDLTPANAEHAARLAKADLASQAVYEMPELQGIMGGHYARERGETETLASAIAEHYQPLGPDDELPSNSLGAVIALADKLDALLCLFSRAELRPSSSKDPYGARRAALGVIRILIGFERQLSFEDILDQAADRDALYALDADARQALLKFLRDRLKVWLSGQNLDSRIIEAVLASASELDGLDLLRRAQALQTMQNEAAFEQLAAANKRIRNILSDAQPGALDSSCLQEPAEKALADALQTTGADFSQHLENRDYKASMLSLAELSAPITQFFDEVLVNAEEPALRNARYALLNIFAERCQALADFAVLSRG